MWFRHERFESKFIFLHFGSWLCFCGLALLGFLISNSVWSQETRSPKRVFNDSPVVIDELLTRPYGSDLPFGPVGKRLWATSPQSWGFPSDVHWVSLSNLGPIDLEVRDAISTLVPARATSFPSHVHLEGAERLFAASASFTARKDRPENPLSKPFTPEKQWSATGSGSRTDWYEVNLAAPRSLKGLKLWFSADAEPRGCRPPARFEVQVPEGDGWKAVRLTSLAPETPAVGENTALFGPIGLTKFRVVFSHADPDFATGIYGIEPLDADPDAARSGPAAIPLTISGDKYITPDDSLVVELRVQNPTSTAQVIEVTPVVDWEGQYQGRILPTRPTGAAASAPFGPWVIEAEAPNRLQGFDVTSRLRFGVTSEPPRPLDVTESRRFTVAVARGREDNASFLRQTLGFRYNIGPGETWIFKAAVEIKRPEEPTALDRVLNLPSTFTRVLEAKSAKLGTIAVERQDTRNVLPEQVAATQAWYNANLANFDCSDPLLRKMYYHRGYLLQKNSLDPQLGALTFPTQTQGRWSSQWFASVNSSGAAHQVRESRWLANPRYWTGPIQTWTSNQSPDHTYPAQVTVAGPGKVTQADWITASAWDGYLVHPDKTLLSALADKLADNVRGVQKASDPDDDGLLSLNHQPTTGLAFDPSLFASTNPQASTPVAVERVDLTSYNFGNAQAVARIYRAVGEAEKAKEFDALADKIRKAVAGAMWNAENGFFHSLKAEDNTQADAKDVTGITPFYFEMFKPGEGYGKAWASILDPAQFWTTWPVASLSRQSPAYSQDGPPAGMAPVPAGPSANGPTWPHANSLVLTAMARTLRADRSLGDQDREKASPLTNAKLWELFQSYTKAQFRNQDPSLPYTGVLYHGETGAWKTPERDTNDSTWLDLLIPDLVGLVPRADEVLEIDPLLPPEALSYFTLDGQRYHGHDITVVWDAPNDNADTHTDGRQGLDVYLDGKLVASSPTLTRLLIDMKTGKPMAEKPARPAATPAPGQPKP